MEGAQNVMLSDLSLTLAVIFTADFRHGDSMKQINKTLFTASLFAVFGITGNASAHDQSGVLGKLPSSTHFYQVTCSDDGNGPADHLSIQVKDELPKAKPLINVLVVTGLTAQSTTDLVDGDALASPLLNIKGGDGSGTITYYVFVTKTALGKETYTLDYHCITSNEVHTGTDIYRFN
jgi:hypothetical protein